MYQIIEMDEEKASFINTWKYEAPYERYSFDGDEAEMEQLLTGYYFAVQKGRELVGFLAVGPAAQKENEENAYIFRDESYTDVAFGLRPDLTGKGEGRGFVQACILEVRKWFPEDGIRLCVRKDNLRAVALYLQMGFQAIYEHPEFMIMIQE